jgi:recombination protein RecA
MERTKVSSELLREQMKEHSETVPKEKPKYDGDTTTMISTGSTLLDLAISGGRVRGGGIPSGILVEIFGPSSSGKTVLLCEIAGAVRRQGGNVMFRDPEARLNSQFASMFGLNIAEVEYDTPNTVPEVFNAVRHWKPKVQKGKEDVIHGVFADSLAALSTDLEMGSDEGDKMGMRRAKEFSEHCRKTCRVITSENYLMVCSNQVRQKTNATKYESPYVSPGGEAIPFYSSLRLRAFAPQKIKKERTVMSRGYKRVIGVKTEFEIFKSTVWKPYLQAPVYIIFDYGIDDVRGNLQFVKYTKKHTTYCVNDEKLDVSMDVAIAKIEEHDLEADLREETIDLWEHIDSQFKEQRKAKVRV